MSSLLTSSQGLVLATAMAVSAGTVILFDLLKDKYFPGNNIIQSQGHSTSSQQKRTLKSCISSGKKKSEDKEQQIKNKKKRVQFAKDVKDTSGNGELYRRSHEHHRKNTSSAQIIINTKITVATANNSCGKEDVTNKMPANHAALYSGILRDRVQRMGYSC